MAFRISSKSLALLAAAGSVGIIAYRFWCRRNVKDKSSLRSYVGKFSEDVPGINVRFDLSPEGIADLANNLIEEANRVNDAVAALPVEGPVCIRILLFPAIFTSQ